MPHYLLTGAGFSRNWGGWLANEAFEHLLGAPEIDDYLRHINGERKCEVKASRGRCQWCKKPTHLTNLMKPNSV
jgi:hypothetical protein